MKSCFSLLIVLIAATADAAPPAPRQPPPKILPDGDPRRDVAIQKPRGELLSLDLATRSGTYRRSADGVVVPFTVLPHCLCQHDNALGDLSDYRIGERLRFITYEGADGRWNRVGLIAEELAEIVAHKEPYYVDSIDAAQGLLVCTRRDAAKTKIVWPNMQITTDNETRYWLGGKPDAKFSDIQVGMGLYMKTHHGDAFLNRVAWDVFLDDASVEKVKADQTAALEKRLLGDGLPGYWDSASGTEAQVTLFTECMDLLLKRRLLSKKGTRVELASAGPDRAATGPRIAATVVQARLYIRNTAYIGEIKLTLDAPPPADFKPTSVIRLWPLPEER